jgi:hypothetical protein
VSDANGGPSGCLTVCYGKCSMYWWLPIKSGDVS